MSKIFLQEKPTGQRATIEGENARYLQKVLRCKIGDEIILTSPEGNTYKADVIISEPLAVIVEIKEELNPNTESPLNIVLLQGILKGRKMDIVIQKTTELGVKEIIPLITQRTIVRETGKSDRWLSISKEASRQSGRTTVPIVHKPMDFNEFFLGLETGQRGIIFWEETGKGIKEIIEEIEMTNLSSPFYLAVGPEGGFTAHEVELANSAGFSTVNFGKRILRAETASIVAVSSIQLLVGDMGGF